LSLFTNNKLLCAGTMICGSLMYPISLWFHKNNYIKYAAYSHCVLHGLVIAGATLTYRDHYLNGLRLEKI
jgi:predicted membrane channel-forming protein YqfA (hemolysin III family)